MKLVGPVFVLFALLNETPPHPPTQPRNRPGRAAEGAENGAGEDLGEEGGGTKRALAEGAGGGEAKKARVD